MKKTIRIILAMVLLMTMISCIAVGTDKQESTKPTLGEELIELKKAKDSGAISDQEYEELKEKLKKSYE